MSQPMNALQAFAYNAQPVRIVERDGQPWFVLKDVCDVLMLTNSRMVAERLEEDEVSLAYVTDAVGRQQETAVISESGLYAVILRSDKPEAKPFRKWVTAEVLPSIRQHGFYKMPSVLKPKRSAAQPPLDKHYYTSTRCTVCNSAHVHRIDQMLSGNVLKQDGKRFSYGEILLWARMKGVTLSKAGLSRHRSDHLLPRLKAQESDLEFQWRKAVDRLATDLLASALEKADIQLRSVGYSIFRDQPTDDTSRF